MNKTLDATRIVGANGNRCERDFYPTPKECTIALIDFLESKFLMSTKNIVWEPACGDGAMTNVFEDRGYKVIGTDIQSGSDFLNTDLCEDFDWIVTNPPFCLSEDFINRASSFGKPFAFLLKTQYWHSSKRKKLFRNHTPAYILPLTFRPDFTGKGKSLLDVIWVVWVGNSFTTQYIPLDKPEVTK